MIKPVVYSKNIIAKISKINWSNFSEFHKKSLLVPVLVGYGYGSIYGMTKSQEYFDNKKKETHICIRLTFGLVSQVIGGVSCILVGFFWPITLPIFLGSVISKHPPLSIVYKNIKEL